MHSLASPARIEAKMEVGKRSIRETLQDRSRALVSTDSSTREKREPESGCPGRHSATFTFTSDAPTGSLFASQRGTQTYSVNGDTVAVPLNPGIFNGDNRATDQFTGGLGAQFMFMQICTGALLQYADAAGVSGYKTNAYKVVNGGNFDGPLFDGATLGCPFQ